MGETHLKNMVNSPKENKRGSCPFKGNPDFPPSTTDLTFKRWARRNLRVIDQLLCDTGVQPFAYLQDKFILTLSDMFRYFQIRHYITNHADWNIIKNAPTNIEIYFINRIKHQLPN